MIDDNYYFQRKTSDHTLSVKDAINTHSEFLNDNYILVKKYDEKDKKSHRCQNHNGKECNNEGMGWSVLTIGNNQVIYTYLCHKHKLGEDYSGDEYDTRNGVKNRTKRNTNIIKESIKILFDKGCTSAEAYNELNKLYLKSGKLK